MEKLCSEKKLKYWYRSDVYMCVECGKESKYKIRVYNENEKGVYFYNDHCWTHRL